MFVGDIFYSSAFCSFKKSERYLENLTVSITENQVAIIPYKKQNCSNGNLICNMGALIGIKKDASKHLFISI